MRPPFTVKGLLKKHESTAGQWDELRFSEITLGELSTDEELSKGGPASVSSHSSSPSGSPNGGYLEHLFLQLTGRRRSCS